MLYNPYNWYWLADDARLFGSAKQALLPPTDPDYVAWQAAGGEPTPWPRDDAGNQTDEALQQVLTPYKLFANLAYYTAEVRRRTQTGGITVNGLPFATDAITTGSLNSAYIFTQTNPTATFSWKLPDGSFVTLGATDIAALQAAVSEFGQNCANCEDQMLTGIETGTITTHEQIDAAFAAISTTFTGLASGLNHRHRRTA